MKSILYITEPKEALPKASTWLKGDEVVRHEFIKPETLDDEDESDKSWKSLSTRLRQIIDFVNESRKVVKR